MFIVLKFSKQELSRINIYQASGYFPHIFIEEEINTKDELVLIIIGLKIFLLVILGIILFDFHFFKN
jgi:hypothetical protein